MGDGVLQSVVRRATAACPGLEATGPARPLPRVDEKSLWQAVTPLEADRASRLFRRGGAPRCSVFARRAEKAVASVRIPAQEFRVPAIGRDGRAYAIAVRSDRSLPCAEAGAIVGVVAALNVFSAMPVREIAVSTRAPSFYRLEENAIMLGAARGQGAASAIDRMKSHAAHEMGHAIFRWRFAKDPGWRTIYQLSLGWRNYEILDDSSYLAVPDRFGHPFDDASEAFASAVHAYALAPERFARYIRNPATPAAMRRFGELVWCFLRERVFDGRVFTRDGADPFRRSRARALLAELRPRRIAALADGLLRHGRIIGARAAAELLREGHADRRIVATLVATFDSCSSYVRRLAVEALLDCSASRRAVPPGALRDAVPCLARALRDADEAVRYDAARALGNLGAVAKGALPALRAASADRNASVGEAARAAVDAIERGR